MREIQISIRSKDKHTEEISTQPCGRDVPSLGGGGGGASENELTVNFNVTLSAQVLGSLTATIRTASKFIALIPSRLIPQMLKNFTGVEF